MSQKGGVTSLGQSPKNTIFFPLPNQVLAYLYIYPMCVDLPEEKEQQPPPEPPPVVEKVGRWTMDMIF